MHIESQNVLAALPALGVELKPGASLAEITYLGIGGTTDLLRLKLHDSIPDVVKLLDAHGIPFKFIGGGSNLLISDDELPWVILQLAQPDPDVVIEGNFAMVDASADLGHTVTLCAKHDLGGMEGLIGVPALSAARCG
jgi:UDP-N-acetylmuramate dehydrogenase